MSIRKLTSVQEARRTLRARRRRCTDAALATINEMLRRSHWASFSRAHLRKYPLDKGDFVIEDSFRSLRNIPNFRLTDFVFRHVDGGVRVEMRRGMGAQPTHLVDKTFIPACACSSRELVAIDTLLEAGDKYAERLAVACHRGGAILEGTRRRRRRKRRR